MKFAALVALVTLVSIAPGPASVLASTPTLSAGGPGGHVLPPTRDEVWSEPPDLEGLIASSEVIGQFGMETEIANDFFLPSGDVLIVARWWGGYYNNYGCSDAGYAAHWNMRFYDDVGCMPGNVVREYVSAAVSETFVHCQSGGYPEFRYETTIALELPGQTLFWFSAQACDHTFPPQVGRLASAGVVNCDAVFRSAYFGYPDWVPCIDVFGQAFDASQEFQAGIGGGYGVCCLPNGSCVETYPVRCGDILHGQWNQETNDCALAHCDPPQACCFVGGLCEMLTDWGCFDRHGESQGAGTICNPNPCEQATADCIDYSAYLHWSGLVNTPGPPGAVAAFGDYGYALASGDLLIIDPTPQPPHIVGTVSLPGDARDVAVSGSHAYVADGVSGLEVIDVQDPQDPRIVGNLFFGGSATCVASSGTYVCVTGLEIGFNVVDVADPLDPRLVGSLPVPAGTIAISGTYAFFTNGDRLQVVDFGEPTSPQIIGGVDMSDEGLSVAVNGTHAFVAVGYPGIEVVDISDPANPQIVGIADTPVRAVDVAVTGTRAYVADPSGLVMVDIADPDNPRLAYTFDWQECFNVAVTPEHCFFTDTGFHHVNVADIENPIPPPIIGSLSMPSGISGLATSGSLACIADGESGLLLVDAKDPAALRLVGSVDTPGNAVDVEVSGHFAYVADWDAGFQVIDIEDPGNPQIVGRVITPGRAKNLALSGNYAYINVEASNPQRGMLVAIKITDPLNPAIGGSLALTSPFGNLVVEGDHAYLAGGDHDLQVVDISHHDSFRVVGFLDDGCYGSGLDIAGDYVYKASSYCGVEVIEVTDPRNPRIVSTIETPTRANTIAVRGAYAYLTDDEFGFHVIDIADPTTPSAIGSRELPSNSVGVAVGGKYAYVSDGRNLLALPAQCEPAGAPDPAGAVSRLGLRAYPNPASGGTAIRIDLPTDCVVRATIHDVGGRLVRDLVDGILTAGPHKLSWDGRDDTGQSVATGVYVVRVSALGVNSTARVVVLR